MAEHRHAGPGHGQSVSTETDLGMLGLALAINVAFMAIEVAVGIIANSLALLSDAAHMLTDAGAIALALVAARLAQRRPQGAMTFGLRRGEILSAQANGLTLLILAAFIVYEGVRRLIAPPDVEAGLIVWVGLAGLLANLAAAWALARANRASLNVEGAFQHNLVDAYGSVAAAGAGAVILITGFERADAIASLVVAALMLGSAYGLLKASGRIFLEAAPAGLDPEAVGRALIEDPAVVEVHDLHVWEVTSGFPALSAHVTVATDADCHQARLRLADLLEKRFEIHHSTLQVEHEPQRLLRIEAPPSAGYQGR
jgi:cobalt-zinc-cadmium efflux system protein